MIKKLSVLALTLVACLSLAAVAFAQSCQDIHNPGTDGCAPSLLAGQEVTLTGFVYVVPGTYNAGAIYWQCAGGTGGMTLYDSSLVLTVGDEISVTGTVGAFGSEIQLEGAAVTVLSTGGYTLPTPITSGDLADGTDLLGSLMCVQGMLTKVSGGFNSTYTIDDGSGPVIVFVDGTTGITEADLDPWTGDIVKIQGATKCYNGEGEILPRYPTDICLVAVPTGRSGWGAMKAMYK